MQAGGEIPLTPFAKRGRIFLSWEKEQGASIDSRQCE